MSKLTRFTTSIRSTLLLESYQGWLKKNDKVLDVGCGDGILDAIIIEKCKITITGCDIKNYLQTDIPFVSIKNPSTLPFPDKSFDKIMFNDVLHHMSFSNQEHMLKEAIRISKQVLIFEVQPTVIGSLSDFVINKFHNFSMDTPLTFRNPQGWIKLFKKLSVEYQFRNVRRPFFYPFSHEAFYLSKK